MGMKGTLSKLELYTIITFINHSSVNKMYFYVQIELFSIFLLEFGNEFLGSFAKVNGADSVKQGSTDCSTPVRSDRRFYFIFKQSYMHFSSLDDFDLC